MVDMENNTVEIHKTRTEPWKVTILYTGRDTMTGGRIKKAESYIGKEIFMLTYGDGVADIDINKLLDFHKSSGKIATLTAVQPTGRFGAIDINEENVVNSFAEKPMGDGNWINGGFLVCEPQIFDYIPHGDDVIFERTPMENLAKDNQLNAFKHTGFWKPMDTLKDKLDLTKMWETHNAPWAIW